MSNRLSNLLELPETFKRVTSSRLDLLPIGESKIHRSVHKRPWGRDVREAIRLKLDVYEHLLHINKAFDQVIRSIGALGKHRPFHAGELARLCRHSKETRASLNSYLTAIIESEETDDAGRRFSTRLAQERKDELDTKP